MRRMRRSGVNYAEVSWVYRLPLHRQDLSGKPVDASSACRRKPLEVVARCLPLRLHPHQSPQEPTSAPSFVILPVAAVWEVLVGNEQTSFAPIGLPHVRHGMHRGAAVPWSLLGRDLGQGESLRTQTLRILSRVWVQVLWIDRCAGLRHPTSSLHWVAT